MPTFDERKNEGLAYLKAAADIIAATADPEALQYWTHLQLSGLIVAPEGAVAGSTTFVNMRVLHVVAENKKIARSLPRLFIFPFYEEDATLGPQFQQAWDGKWAAMHQSENNMIYLFNKCPEVDFIKGCRLLHEAGHSVRAFAEGRIGRTAIDRISDELLMEEGDLHYLEARLWREHAGNKYQAVLEKAVYRIRQVLNGKEGFVDLAWDERWARQLDECFGPSPTARARDERFGTFVVNAHLAYVDASCCLNYRFHRANVIKNVYRIVGHRQ